MSLVKKHDMTAKKVAANRRNQKLCHGPTTSEGRERIRAAHLRHGFYSEAEEVALRALGEDPAQFQGLHEGLWETYRPTDAGHEGLVIHLTQCTWLINRAVRMQEGYAVRQAQDVNIGRQDRLHVQMMRLKMTAKNLQSLAKSVAREHYVTPPDDLEKMKTLHQSGMLKAMGEFALDLFYQLQPPGTGEDGVDLQERSRRALLRIKEIFGLASDTPPEQKIASNPSHLQDCQPGAGTRGEGVASASSRPQGSQQNAHADVAPDFSPAHANLKVGATQPAKKVVQYPNITVEE